MKATKLLVLAAAVAAASSAYAMQPMTDASMSSATGQDGIDITLSNTQVSVDYLRFGTNGGLNTAAFTGAASGFTDPSANYSLPAYVELQGFGLSGGSTNIQLSMGASAAGASTASASALKLVLSANSLTFNPFIVSLGTGSNLLNSTAANGNTYTVGSGSTATTLTNAAKVSVNGASVAAENGLLGINLGTVSIPAAELFITQGFALQTAAGAVPLSASGITIQNAGCSGTCIDIKGLNIFSPVDGASFLAASDIAISNMGASAMSIGAVGGAAATAANTQLGLGLSANQLANGGVWISMGPSTIGSVAVTGITMGGQGTGQAGSNAGVGTLGNLALEGVHLGSNNIFISALK